MDGTGPVYVEPEPTCPVTLSESNPPNNTHLERGKKHPDPSDGLIRSFLLALLHALGSDRIATHRVEEGQLNIPATTHRSTVLRLGCPNLARMPFMAAQERKPKQRTADRASRCLFQKDCCCIDDATLHTRWHPADRSYGC